MAKIQIKRGLKSELPILDIGELGYCTDSKELFIGTATGNVLVNDTIGGTTEPTYIVKEGWSTSGVRNFGTPMTRIYIDNIGNADLTFTIGSIVITVKSKEEFEDTFDPFNQITINASDSFNAYAIDLKDDSSNPQFSVKDHFSGNSNITRSYTPAVHGITISNDGVESLSYTVNGITFIVEQDTISQRYFEPFTEVSVNSASVPYRAFTVGNYLQNVTGSFPDTTAPNNITGLFPSGITTTTLNLNWTASTSPDVQSYDVFNNTSLIGNTNTTSYNVTGLLEKTEYTFVIKAKDAAGNSSSGIILVVSTADATAPVDVTDLNVTNLLSNSLTLNWTASISPDIASYDIYNSASLIGNTAASTFNVTGLTSTTGYTFRVSSKDMSGNTSVGVTVEATTTAMTDTTPPVVIISPAAGLYNATQNVTLSTEEGATIYYTLDGSTPTTSSSVYSTPIAISSATTIKYFGKDTVGNSSSVQTASYTFDTVIPVLTFNPTSKSYNTANMSVTLSVNETATIYYTIDGTVPTTASTVYTAPIVVTGTQTIKAIARDTAGNQSAVGSQAYTYDITPPGDVTGLTVTELADKSAAITFNNINGDQASVHAFNPSGYRTGFFGNTGARRFGILNLTPQITQSVIVKTYDSAGNVSTGVTVPITTTANVAYTHTSFVNDASLLLFAENLPTATPYGIYNPQDFFTDGNSYTVVATAILPAFANVISDRNLTSNFTGVKTRIHFTRDASNIGVNIYGYNTSTSAQNVNQSINIATAPVFTQMYHFVIVREATKLVLYVDNVKISETAIPANTAFNPISTQMPPLMIGSTVTGSTIKNIAIYNRTLTAGELTQNFNALK
jgi:chitodextrinase